MPSFDDAINRPRWYILAADGRTPVPCDDLEIQGRWAVGQNLHVGDDVRGDIRVSTVFLGLDHNWGPGPPLLWETMIFGGAHEEYCERYTTYDDATAGHALACVLAFGEEPLPKRGLKLDGPLIG